MNTHIHNKVKKNNLSSEYRNSNEHLDDKTKAYKATKIYSVPR